MSNQRFDGELIAGHKGVAIVRVPFDPERAWGCKPVRLEGRRHGWPVRGRINGAALEGYIGERWGRFFIIVDAPLRQAAGLAIGDAVTVVVEPSEDARVITVARAQSMATTQPKTARPDAVCRSAT